MNQNRFIGLPFQRLRFEYDKRDRRRSEIKSAMRREERDMDRIEGYDLPFGAKTPARERYQRTMENFKADLEKLEKEMAEIEQAMDHAR